MRVALSLFLSALLWASSVSYAQTGEHAYPINEQATAKAPWKIGEIIAEGNVIFDGQDRSDIYRKFMGITNKGYFVVQDFYQENNKKVIDPIAITQQNFVADITQLYRMHPFNGQLVVWYKDGQKKEDCLFQDGKPQGICMSWYSNGQKEFEGQYHEGKEHGRWNFWHDNGKKRLEAHYQDGEKHGSWMYWHDNGQKDFGGHYQNGKGQGLWIGWYENGQKMEAGQYQDGEPQGLWTYWDSEGKKISETVYEAGKEISQKIFD